MNAELATYAILWFEGNDNMFTLVDEHDKTVLLTKPEALHEAARILSTEAEVQEAESGIRYAVPANLLDTLFGWVV